jgi:hypothetical protein
MLRLSIHPKVRRGWDQQAGQHGGAAGSGNEPVIWIALLRGPSACAELLKYSGTVPIGPGPCLVARSHLGRGVDASSGVVASRGGGVDTCRHRLDVQAGGARGFTGACRPAGAHRQDLGTQVTGEDGEGFVQQGGQVGAPLRG